MSIFPTKILLATDGSEEAEMAAKTAVGLVQQTGSELHIIHVLASPLDTHDPSSFEPGWRRQLETRARSELKDEVDTIEASGGAVANTHLGVGRPDAEIVALAEEIGAGLIVMGSRGLGGVRRALMGSVSSAVVRHAHCPVMVVRGEAVIFPTKILLATDGSEDSELAARAAADLAKSSGSELHVVYVQPMPERHSRPMRFAVDLPPQVVESVEQEGRSKLEKLGQKMRQESSEVTQAHARVGLPAAEIVTLAEKVGAGLIVMGSRGLGGVRRALMGSVSDSVVRNAHFPVLVVRPEKARATEKEAGLLMTIRAELPGLSPEDVDISLHENVLTISGERKAEQEEERGGYYIRERSYGYFSRSFTLPQGTDESKVHARFDQGVLEVTVEGAGAIEEPKRIHIEGSGS
jgi:nucleotide-binding universal stress UspA family protein/HSP20 family molecular chaperone IbpA